MDQNCHCQNVFDLTIFCISSNTIDISTLVKNFSGRDELLKQIPNHDILLCTSFDKVDSELLDTAGESLRCVASVSAGYNHVDTSQLASRGIVLGNTPDVLTDSVAEIGVVLVLDCLRNVVKEANKVSEGKWTPSTELFRFE